MPQRTDPWTLVGTALALLWTAGCAGGSSPLDSGPSPAGDCAFDVRNETRAVLSVTAGGSGVQRLGEPDPGGRVRFHESCGVEQVVVTATVVETPTPLPDPGVQRDAMIQRTVNPRPGEVVQVALRFDWRRRPGPVSGPGG